MGERGGAGGHTVHLQQHNVKVIMSSGGQCSPSDIREVPGQTEQLGGPGDRPGPVSVPASQTPGSCTGQLRREDVKTLYLCGGVLPGEESGKTSIGLIVCVGDCMM